MGLVAKLFSRREHVDLDVARRFIRYVRSSEDGNIDANLADVLADPSTASDWIVYQNADPFEKASIRADPIQKEKLNETAIANPFLYMEHFSLAKKIVQRAVQDPGYNMRNVVLSFISDPLGCNQTGYVFADEHGNPILGKDDRELIHNGRTTFFGVNPGEALAFYHELGKELGIQRKVDKAIDRYVAMLSDAIVSKIENAGPNMGTMIEWAAGCLHEAKLYRELEHCYYKIGQAKIDYFTDGDRLAVKILGNLRPKELKTCSE